jgi:hypothetical protein
MSRDAGSDPVPIDELLAALPYIEARPPDAPDAGDSARDPLVEE